MKIYIVMLHYGKIEVTQKCIASLVQHDQQFEKLILINNDKNIILSPSQFPLSSKKIHIINSKKNLGFAAGVNVGIKFSLQEKAEYIFLLNNDTIIEKDFLKKLLGVFLMYPQAGIVGPVLSFHKDGNTLYDLGGDVNLLIGRTYHHNVEVIPRNNLNAQMVTYISGCCMLIKRDVFEKIGFFDEKFFLYYEDVDFCLRSRKKGFSSYVLPETIIYHELSKAAGRISPFSVYYQTKSGVIFGKKYCKIRLLNMLFLFAQSCLFFIKNKQAGIGAFRGLVDGLQS